MNDNIEDRLRQAFETEAEQLHTPPGSLETTVRRGQRRRASTVIGGAALAVVLIGGTAIGFQVAQSGPDPELDRDEVAATQPTETESAEQTTDTIGEGSTVPVTETFIWEQVRLPVAAGTDVFNIRVGSLNGTFIAIGQRFSLESNGPSLAVWESEDGESWEEIPGPADFGESLENVVFSETGIMAVGRTYAELPNDGTRQESLRLFTSRDGRSWQQGTVDFELESNEFAWIPGGAIGNGAFLVAVTANIEPPQPPIILEEAGITIQENHNSGTATIIDTATGETIAAVPIETIYGYGNEGPTLYDSAGEEIAVIPGEAIELAYETARLEASSGLEFPETLVVEHEGIRLTLDSQDYTYTAEDTSTGEVIAAGNQDELYRPPRFVIRHPDTGEVLVDMEWAAFSEAQERSYGEFTDPEFEFRSRTLLYRSTDGTTWELVDSPQTGARGDVLGLAYGPAGFVLEALSAEDYQPAIWRSEDGTSWSLVTDTAARGLGESLAADDEYYYAFGYGDGSSGVVRSRDLTEWENLFPLNHDTWVSHIAVGDLGIVAFGETDNFVEPDLSITKEGRTLLISPEEGFVLVTEDATGEILARIVFDPYAEEPPAGIVVQDNNDGFAVTAPDGSVVMTVTNDDMEQAVSGADFEVEDGYYPTPERVFLFSPSGGDDWARGSTAGLDAGYISDVAVGTESVVITGEPSYPRGEEIVAGEDGGTTAVTSIAAEELPPPSVWVGRPG